MTMPHLMNCEHSGDGWCLACVGKLMAERDELQGRVVLFEFVTMDGQQKAVVDAMLRAHAERETMRDAVRRAFASGVIRSPRGDLCSTECLSQCDYCKAIDALRDAAADDDDDDDDDDAAPEIVDERDTFNPDAGLVP